MSHTLNAFERRTAIYNAGCDLHGEQVDRATALARIRQSFPDTTDDEFLRAVKAFSRVSSVMCARAEAEGDIFTPEVEREIDAIVAAYANGEELLEQ